MLSDIFNSHVKKAHTTPSQGRDSNFGTWVRLPRRMDRSGMKIKHIQQYP